MEDDECSLHLHGESKRKKTELPVQTCMDKLQGLQTKEAMNGSR
jgi:hypothetical protein